MKKIYNSPIIGLIPLGILIGYAINLVWVGTTTNIVLQKEHIAGLIFVVLAVIAFLVRYKPAILFLGFTLLIGLFGFISLTPAIATAGLSISGVSIIRFQPIFLLWIIIHFTLSGKHYLGLATEEYWKELRSEFQFRRKQR